MTASEKTSDSGGGLNLGKMDDWRKKSGLSCSFFIFAALNTAMVVVGAKALKLCPLQTMIPIYLIVAGTTSLALLVARLLVSHVLIPSINKVGISDGTPEGSPGVGGITPTVTLALKLLKTFDTLASIFSTCWLIVGSFYVYSTYEVVDHHDPNDPDYCDYTAYTFAFIVITIGFISLGLSVIAALCACFCRSSDDE